MNKTSPSRTLTRETPGPCPSPSMSSVGRPLTLGPALSRPGRFTLWERTGPGHQYMRDGSWIWDGMEGMGRPDRGIALSAVLAAELDAGKAGSLARWQARRCKWFVWFKTRQWIGIDPGRPVHRAVSVAQTCLHTCSSCMSMSETDGRTNELFRQPPPRLTD